MRIKFILMFLFVASVTFSQNEDFLRRKYSYTYTKYNFYGFFDVVRFAGIGAEYRPQADFTIDFKIGAIYPNGILHTGIAANDYFSDKGIGLMLSPKFFPCRKKRFFVGLNAAFYVYGYKKQWEHKGISPTTFSTDNDELRDRKTTSIAFGPTLGWSINVDNVNIEIFTGLGGEFTKNKITVYQSPVQYAYPSFPYTYHQDMTIVNVLAGIKLGFGMNQQKTYVKRYYIDTFRELIYNDNRFVIDKYRSKRISRVKLQEYYDLRKEQIAKIGEAYNMEPNDTTTLNNLVKLGQKNISTYVNYVYGQH